MASATSDLLAFKDYEDFGDSPQISVNSPKKVTLNGNNRQTPSNFFKIIKIKIFQKKRRLDLPQRLAFSKLNITSNSST